MSLTATTKGASGGDKLDELAREVAATFRLAADRVAAHRADPDAFPMPRDPASVEHVLNTVYNTLPATRQAAIAARVVAGIRSDDPVRRQLLGEYSAINLASSGGVSELVRAQRSVRTVSFLESDRDSLVAVAHRMMASSHAGRAGTDVALAEFVPGPKDPIFTDGFDDSFGKPAVGVPGVLRGRGSVSPQPATNLVVSISAVHCDSDTDESFEDEIYAAGFSVDDDGTVRSIQAKPLGHFETNTVRNQGFPCTLAHFNITGPSWPKVYFVGVLLIEKRDGGTVALLNLVTDEVARVVRNTLRDHGVKIGAGIGAAAGAPIGLSLPAALVGAIAGWLIGETLGDLFQWVTRFWNEPDFLFSRPPLIQIKLESPERRHGREVREFVGDEGAYTMACTWKMT